MDAVSILGSCQYGHVDVHGREGVQNFVKVCHVIQAHKAGGVMQLRVENNQRPIASLDHSLGGLTPERINSCHIG